MSTSHTVSSAALKEAQPLTKVKLASIAASSRKLPKKKDMVAALDVLNEVEDEPSLTSFEKKSLELAPVAKRFLELASSPESAEQKSEFVALVETLRSSDVAKRLVALGTESPMSCA